VHFFTLEETHVYELSSRLNTDAQSNTKELIFDRRIYPR
jgi:hypothetical protein